MGISLDLRARVVRGRLVLEVGNAPPVVVGRVLVCPCCGEKSFVEAPCPR